MPDCEITCDDLELKKSYKVHNNSGSLYPVWSRYAGIRAILEIAGALFPFARFEPARY